MGDILIKLQSDLIKYGAAARSIKAREWLRKKIRNINIDTENIKTLKDRQQEKNVIGNMYFFSYDPKTKKTMPYYDTFPIVFPIESYPDGFLGLNLHYLDPSNRLLLLDRLSVFRSNKSINDQTKLRLSYKLIAETSKLQLADPCIKKYLYSNVRSKFIMVDPTEWDFAVLLPTKSFVGKSNQFVWSQSKKVIEE